jgi:hypothetical protein
MFIQFFSHFISLTVNINVSTSFANTFNPGLFDVISVLIGSDDLQFFALV